MYINKKEIAYYSKRYDKHITVEIGFKSNGADWEKDIKSDSWWVHDKLCDTGVFDDGTPCTNWQASTILSDILIDEIYYIRAPFWWAFTWVFGCKKCRENGMF